MNRLPLALAAIGLAIALVPIPAAAMHGLGPCGGGSPTPIAGTYYVWDGLNPTGIFLRVYMEANGIEGLQREDSFCYTPLSHGQAPDWNLTPP